MPGIHWYHAHHHGATMFHVMSGLVGALEVMWPVDSKMPDTYPASSDRHLLMLTHIPICGCVKNVAGFGIRDFQVCVAVRSCSTLFVVQFLRDEIRDPL